MQTQEGWGLSLRRAVDMNKAFLAQLNWRLLKEIEKLWLDMTKSKHNTNPILVSNSKSNHYGSHIWKAMIWSKELLQRGISWKIINGKKANLWMDVWIDKNPLKDLAMAPLEGTLLQHKFCECWKEEGGWKWEVFGHQLPSETLLQIASTMICIDIEDEDQLG